LGVVIAASVIPLCFAAAFAVAAYEEHRFIQDHRQGVGPTARWTVPHHWLAYDAQAKHLSGSD
jgi:hypothetical protein